MNKNGGWLKLHRSLTEWEWYSDINTKVLFLHLLLTVNHKEKKWRGQIIQPGSIITGRLTLAEQTGLTVQQVRTCLNKLKSTSELTIKSTSKFSLITINNWSKFQETNQQSNQQPNHQVTIKQPSSNHQVTTTKECKNVKNERTNKLVDKNINDSMKQEFNELIAEYEQNTKTRLRSLKPRLTKYRSRRKLYSAEELREALRLMLLDPFLQGDNDSSKRYGDIDYLLRSDQNLEKLLNNTKLKCKQHSSQVPSVLSIEI
jgi:TusA-related sulfurtransferase